MSKYSLDDLISWALYLFAFAVIFSVTVVEAALFLTLLLLLVKKYREHTLSDIRPALTGHPLFAPWIIYLAVCLLTSLTAYYPVKGLGQLNSDFLKYVCLSTLLLAVKKEHLPKLAAVYTSGAVIAALVGIAEVVRSMAVGDTDITRANAFMNAVRYGEVMGIALALIAGRILLPAEEVFRNENLFYKLAAVPVFAAIVLSQTRGAYLGVLVLLLSLMLYGKGLRQKFLRLVLGLALVGAATAIFNPTISSRFMVKSGASAGSTAAQGAALAVNIRLELWKLGLKMFEAHPVLGVGPDNIKKVFKKFHPEPIGYEETWGSLHNLYIHQAAERGILGLGALLLLFGAFFLFALSNFRASASPYALWALGALPAYFAMNLTEISFQHVHTSFAIFLAMAFGAAAKKSV